ncbi:unnamed protein product [Mytilus coruscus]|uniref:Uncharacterized protein n=1 Tax=Mytilus coruscus TaxID=42192 RepID=A0A6J8C9G1_MYTCO|nr:unnamed protein product [Mytilus coruscus]
MLWGRPASPSSNEQAVTIGPGAVSLMNCRTGQFGFLALEPWIYRDRPPPLKIWFKCKTAISKVETFYGFHNFLDSTCEMLGKQFIKKFLEDSFVIQSVLPGSCDDFFQHLQGQPNSPYKGFSIGKMSREDIAIRLTEMGSPRASKVCIRMIEFITLADLQLQDVILSGIIENQLVRFPVIQTWDTAGHKTFKLIPNKFVALCSPDASDKEGEAERLTTAIIQELELRQLTYARKFNYLRGTAFPWIIPVMDKLNKRKKILNARQLLDTLTFLFCVALIQQKWFVNFQHLEPMLSTLPVNQFAMQMLEILGNIDLSFVGKLQIRRLHKSIPFQLPQATATATTAEKPEVDIPKPTEESEDVNQIQDVVEDYGENTQCQDVEKPPTTHLPMAVNTFWTAPELEILHAFNTKEYRKSTFKQLFEIYCNLCRDRKLPDRNYTSFKRKLIRVMSNE